MYDVSTEGVEEHVINVPYYCSVQTSSGTGAWPPTTRRCTMATAMKGSSPNWRTCPASVSAQHCQGWRGLLSPGVRVYFLCLTVIYTHNHAHTHIQTHTHTHTNTHMHKHIHTHAHMHTHTNTPHTHTHTRTHHTHMHAHIHTYKHAQRHTHTCAHTHAHKTRIHTHTHACMHTQTHAHAHPKTNVSQNSQNVTDCTSFWLKYKNLKCAYLNCYFHIVQGGMLP